MAGQYGPEWWEVAPAVAVVLVSIGLPVCVLVWLWSRVGWWAALLAATALGYGVRALVLRRSQAAARKKRAAVRFTLADIDAADDRRFRNIVGRLLVRDGWTAKGVRVNDAGAVHLVGERAARRMGCAFERGADDAGHGGAAVLRPVSAAPDDPPEREGGPAPLLLIVCSGTFPRERVVWAARNSVRLVDRVLLQRWAAGEDLWDLLDLGHAD